MILSQCAYCDHLARSSGAHPGCKAFPGGIPAQILANQADHRKPYEGDDDVRFSPRPFTPAATLDGLHRLLDKLAS